MTSPCHSPFKWGFQQVSQENSARAGTREVFCKIVGPL